MVVFLVHLGDDARRCLEGLTGHGGDDFVGVCGLGFFNRLLPHVDTDVSRFHRVVGQRLVLVTGDALGFGVSAPFFDELVIGRVLDRLEVVPGGQVTDQRLGVHAAQFFFAHREGDNRHVFGFEAGVAEFFVERHVGVTVDGGNHCGFATGGEFLHVSHDGLVIRVTKRCVFLVDVAVFHAFAFEVSAQDFVGGAWVHIVSAQQNPTLGGAAFFAHQVVHSRDGLLVGGCTCVEHVFGELFTFVLNGVEQQAVHFFNNGQHRLAGHRSPAAEDHGDFVLAEQLLGFFSEQGPVGGRVHDDGLELLAHDAAFGIDLVNGHQDGVFEDGLGNGHGARQAVQNADLDGAGALGVGRQSGQARQGDGGGECLEGKTTLHVMLLRVG